jgi:hypothetical protein
LAGSFGSFVFQRISRKKRQAARSAAERQVVGCPEPDAVVIRREWMRRRVAISRRCSVLAMGRIPHRRRDLSIERGMIA